jgi:hypothetical protein
MKSVMKMASISKRKSKSAKMAAWRGGAAAMAKAAKWRKLISSVMASSVIANNGENSEKYQRK